ncbi:MAG: B12-binding domain-containing radical SAM protein [Holophaga sp.]|nr:B12-binding domain-containing radical SAM protein [Holophaga sp.]
MHLVLVAIHIEASPRAVPLGPAQLAAALKRAYPAGLDTRILDLYLGQSAEACADRILAGEPQAVGFSMYVWNRGLAMETARILKRRRPGIIVFAGGSEATADRAGVEGDPAVDFVLPGEAEELIVTAMGALLRGAGLEELRAGIRPAPIADLGGLASPFLDGILDPRDYPGQLWELSRGCPFSCDFCFESRGGSGTRRVPMARVEAELRLFEQCMVSQVLVLDPTFNYHKAQAKEVLRLIRRTAPGIHFFFELRAEFLDRELAQLFAAVKCTLQIGLQSAHGPVLKNIGRSFDRNDFEAKILLLHQAGASYGFDLIYGLPGDTLQGFRASLDFALGLMPNHVDIFRLSVLPGTRLRETAPGLGLAFQPGNPYQVLSAPGFDGADLDRAERLARACDLFYNQGRAVPWFAILLAALDIGPSECFARFQDYLEANPGTDVTELQSGFVLAAFRDDPNPALGRVAADIATYFGRSGALAEADLEADPPAGAAGPLRMNPRACFARFHHDPRALLDQLAAGITELEDLTFMLPPLPCEAVLFMHQGEPALRTLAPDEAELLRRFQLGGGLAGESAAGVAFLRSLVAEGLVLEPSA